MWHHLETTENGPMAQDRIRTTIIQELADLFSSQPSRQHLLDFRPSRSLQKRARNLLLKQNNGEATCRDQHELDEFEFAEILVRLIKADLRTQRSADSAC